MSRTQRQLVELANLAGKASLLFVWPSYNEPLFVQAASVARNLTSRLMKPNVTVTQHLLEGLTGVKDSRRERSRLAAS